MYLTYDEYRERGGTLDEPEFVFSLGLSSVSADFSFSPSPEVSVFFSSGSAPSSGFFFFSSGIVLPSFLKILYNYLRLPPKVSIPKILTSVTQIINVICTDTGITSPPLNLGIIKALSQIQVLN